MEFNIYKKEKDKINEKIEREICDKVYDFFVNYMKKLGFEDRIGQQDMALDISEAIRDDQHILVEAGVGIGKSYAYLVPLIFYNKLFNKPIAISTSTISLQEQLMGDIHDVAKMIGYDPEVVLSKGMTHYACKKRIDNLLDEIKLNGNREELERYKWIEKWIKRSGDRVELPKKMSEEEWGKINVSDCTYGKCDYYNQCYFMKKREKMGSTSGVILCNHDLLIVDAQRKNKNERTLLSNNIKFIVIDEAHNLEEKVRSSLQEKWNYKRVMSVVNDAVYFLKRCNVEINNPFVKEEIAKLSKNIFGKLSKDINLYIEENSFQVNDLARFKVIIGSSKDKVNDLITKLRDLSVTVSLVDNNILFHSEALQEHQDDIIEEFEEGIDFFEKLEKSEINTLFWLELSNLRNRYTDVDVMGCPKHMDKTIYKLFFNNDFETNFSSRKLPRTIITSATLTDSFEGDNEDKYRYMIKNIGFPIEDNTFISEPKYSPFDYNNNALIYYKDNMEHPMKERSKFLKQCVDEIENLLKITEGKALILFTAKVDMEYIYTQLNNKNLTYKLLKQAQGSSQEEVVEEFKKNENSVLLGSGAFWEGINIPGKSLSNVIVVRLPFPVPDPIIDYKREQAKNPLMEVNVPEMIIKLRQGVGRLIRKDDDRGIVAILDPRAGDVYNTEYKNIIWDSLQIKNRTNNIETVKKFSQSQIIGNKNKESINTKRISLSYREFSNSKMINEDAGVKLHIVDCHKKLDDMFIKEYKCLREIRESVDNIEHRKILIQKINEILTVLEGEVPLKYMDDEANNRKRNNEHTNIMIENIERKIRVWKAKSILFNNNKVIGEAITTLKNIRGMIHKNNKKYDSIMEILSDYKNKDVLIIAKNKNTMSILKNLIEDRYGKNIDVECILKEDIGNKKYDLSILTYVEEERSKELLEKVNSEDKIMIIYEHEREK